jgi:hypothetical protein
LRRVSSGGEGAENEYSFERSLQKPVSMGFMAGSCRPTWMPPKTLWISHEVLLSPQIMKTVNL